MIDANGAITYRNKNFQTSFNNIRPVKFTEVLADEEDLEDFNIAFSNATKNPNTVEVFCCKMLQRTGVARWSIWEIMKQHDQYYLAGQLLYDVVSKTSFEYEKIKKSMEDIKMMISHEMRQPVTSIVSLVTLIRAAYRQQEPEEFERLCQMLEQSTTALDSAFKRAIDPNDLGINTR